MILTFKRKLCYGNGPPIFSDIFYIYNALEKITSKDFSILPVVAADDHSRLLGVLTRKDILDAYDRTVIKKSITYE
jgi:CBS domain-containing protein